MKKRLVNFIAKHLPEVDTQSVSLPSDIYCAFSGEYLTEGVPLRSVIQPATANLSDTFRVPSNYVSVAVAKCFKASRELRGNLFITENGIQHPMISAKSATAKNRPAWRAVFGDFLANPRPAVLIVTDESKRRLWVNASVSESDTSTGFPLISVFVNNADMSRNLTLDAIRLHESIQIVQKNLHDGFSKKSIRRNLFTHRESLLKIGLKATDMREKECAMFRNDIEFSVATLIGTI